MLRRAQINIGAVSRWRFEPKRARSRVPLRMPCARSSRPSQTTATYVLARVFGLELFSEGWSSKAKQSECESRSLETCRRSLARKARNREEGEFSSDVVERSTLKCRETRLGVKLK